MRYPAPSKYHLFLHSHLVDLLDITDSQTIEEIHNDDHDKENEDEEQKLSKPVLHRYVGVVKLSSEHHDCLFKSLVTF